MSIIIPTFVNSFGSLLDKAAQIVGNGNFNAELAENALYSNLAKQNYNDLDSFYNLIRSGSLKDTLVSALKGGVISGNFDNELIHLVDETISVFTI